MVVFSCKKEVTIEPGSGNEDWTDATHGSSATPNYNKVFTDTKVHRLDIVLDEGAWDAMQDDLEDLLGSTSSGGGPGGAEHSVAHTKGAPPTSSSCNSRHVFTTKT